MILAGTSILLTFARVDGLELLWELFPDGAVSVSPAMFREIREAIAQGCAWLIQLPGLIEQGDA
jgi:hypothetical protein